MLKHLVAASVLTVGLAACSGTSLTDSLSNQSTALTSAQCNFQGFQQAAAACFDTYDACIKAANADVTACRDALHACLPPPPAGDPRHGGPGGPGMGGDCDGGRPEGPPPGEGPFGPPPELDGGRGPGGPGGHHGGPGGLPPGAPLPDAAAITACQDALTSCLAATGADAAACQETMRQCVHDAFQAAFQQRCAEAQAQCASGAAPADVCARITDHCNRGVGQPPLGPDGGVQCQ